MTTPLAAIVFEFGVGAGLAQAGHDFLVSPFGLAAMAAPLGITGLVAGLGYRHDRLARQIRSERAVTEQLRQAAYHDSLTGLRNRHALGEDAERILACQTGKSAPSALLLFDLDRFKYINDTMGHAAGDLVLKFLATRLQARCGAGQRIYRLGGDEFVLFWEGAPDKASISAFCEGLTHCVFQPVESDAGPIDTAGSIGIAVRDGDTSTLSELLKRADLALYHAKTRSRSNYSFFTATMDCDQRKRLEMESAMREGIANGAFHLDYQPVVKVSTLSVSGFSGRLRWTRCDEGDLAQQDFLPMAETSGLIVPLGKWMLQRALIDAAGWTEKTSVTLPVSAVQLRDPEFASSVIDALDAAGFEPGRLVLDVAPDAAPDATRGEANPVLGTLERLRDKGVKISVSEFAASIAGLSMARAFPVDRVRLDLGGIKTIAGAQRMEQMLTLFLQLASTVETPVTLTGIDTQDDLKSACAAGADEVEGTFAGTRFCPAQASEFAACVDSAIRTDPEELDLRKAG
ncbi:EAL domain-containing protein [Hoeflea sp. YIM 152468]|uniref:putative bifunctional diguanylate cyclase/phosphodiesterase n=1 Tax=Hoeflea sp. YIM 152468 TaxID=3031759 RepID=UPI0023DCD67E|nr:EAL domain-containing protein [Hoeflea sp. YIM 152468]MDF1609595.1 EAL domain-containing protein [Hoeflea sp. YIM 152468]